MLTPDVILQRDRKIMSVPQDRNTMRNNTYLCILQSSIFMFPMLLPIMSLQIVMRAISS